jgi:hypothetical protein
MGEVCRKRLHTCQTMGTSLTMQCVDAFSFPAGKKFFFVYDVKRLRNWSNLPLHFISSCAFLPHQKRPCEESNRPIKKNKHHCY